MQTRHLMAAAVLWLATIAAQAAELRVVSPGFVYSSGLPELAASFTRDTGIKVRVDVEGMGSIVERIQRGEQVSDVIVLPLQLMSTLAVDGGIVAGSYTPLGRVPIGLAVKKGAPHPDISTVAKLAEVLRKGGTILYSNPATGSMSARLIDTMLKRPEFAGVRGQVSREGEGGQALRRGEGDMALQLICQVIPYPDIELVGPVPRELGAYLDGALAISTRSTQRADAARFIQYITRSELTPQWAARGLTRFDVAATGPSMADDSAQLVTAQAAQTERPAPDPRHVELMFGKDLKWTGEPGARRAILYGDPSQPGPYAILYHWGEGQFSNPHTHNSDRHAYVVSGTWWKSSSSTRDPATLYPIPAGSYVRDVANQVHWDGAKQGECLVLVSGVGPVTSTPFNAAAPATSPVTRVVSPQATPDLKPPDAPLLPYRFVQQPVAPAGQRFGNVAAVAMTPQQHLLVLNRNPQIMMVEYDARGRLLRTFNPNIAINAHGMRVDRHGNIWVVDSFLNVVWKLNAAGEPLMMLGRRGELGAWTDGSWNGMLNQPLDVAFDADDNIYVAQGHGGTSNPAACTLCATYQTARPPVSQGSDARLLKFDAQGRLLASRSFDDGSGPYPTIHSVIVTPRGEVWVADRQRNRIVVLDRELRQLREIAQPNRVSGLLVDARGELWMSSGMDGMVMKLDSEGRVVGWFGKAGRTDDPSSSLIGEAHYLAVTADQRTIYIADSVNAKVLKLQRER